ncbi:hypothetical protein EDC30_101441 [Paucimonas lemoignei]|uniref:Immunity protein 72 of polymorphic toxin system n=1 Tax=Paucimonas lemoignei TaxID=29443 RepID=A0A4R3I439_PAULE|nr:hypothetical protein [Paucimonas lemoignei]TCS39485.1 hypothetical protein EDC30_101441 [Paucimonas lemoignei]
MATPLIPQEIYLLERYISLERFGKMCDAWRDMLNYTEDLLARFVQNLPPDYRNRPLPEQPDIVWGERVLPNFRETMQILDDAYIKLSHGDYEALGRSCGVNNGIRGQSEFWSGWMHEVEPGAEEKYYELLFEAKRYAKPIDITSSGTWGPGALTTNYDEVLNEPLNPPSSWPTYRLNPQVKVKSGDRTPQTGFYLPDVDHGFPTLMIKSDDDLLGEANEAMVKRADGTKGYVPATWTLIERVADESDMSAAPSLVAPQRLRVDAGKPCPQTGYWFTPAQMNSRRYFKEGDIMPNTDSEYGTTIWQWDSNQN